MKELKLRAYLFTFNNHARNSAQEIKGMSIIAKDKKEALRMFTYWMLYVNFKNNWRIEVIDEKNIRKNKYNARWFTEDYYNREWEEIRKIQAEPLTKPIEGGETHED